MTDSPRRRRIALIGNPNTGKTTLFNALTGLSQRAANYPGVTVDIKSGHAGDELEILDLPGTYSLAAQSLDEMVVIDLLRGRRDDEPPVDLVVVTVDASHIQRNLYLTTQVMELGLPAVVALNMMDLAERQGMSIDADGLAASLGIPVIPVVATKAKGVAELRDAIRKGLNAGPAAPSWTWPESIDRETANLGSRLGGDPFLVRRALIDEGGSAERELLALLDGEAQSAILDARTRIGKEGRSPASLEAHMRYRWIQDTLAPLVTRRETGATTSRRIDRLLTHRVTGLAFFVVVMGTLFLSVFQLAAPVMDWIDGLFEGLSGLLTAAFAGTSLDGGILQSLVVDGAVAGVSAVLIFLPQIAFLFLFISILEDCGYMSRAAFLMDRVLRFCGLSGHSFIPMLSSFACAVPGIMATRTIRNRRDRITTILVAPLMSCSARIPVYTIMIAAFIPATKVLGILSLQGVVFGAMYFLGILVAIPVALILKWTLLRGESSTFVMELPPYRLPQLKTVSLRVMQCSWAFIRQAGTIIFAMSLVIWALGYFPRSSETEERFTREREEARLSLSGPELESRLVELGNLESGEFLRGSVLGRMGKTIEPLVKPLGWDWTIGMGTLAAFPARELLVSTLNIIYDLGEGDDDASGAFIEKLHAARKPDGTRTFTIPVALSILVFIALCCQCMSTLAVMRRETASWRWPLLAFGYMTVFAYVGAMLTYQLGTAMGL